MTLQIIKSRKAKLRKMVSIEMQLKQHPTQKIC